MQKLNGLTYTIGDVDAGHLANIDMMASKDPAIASVARLNRDLVNVVTTFLEDEAARGSSPVDVMEAAMHGVTTVCGALLLQADRKNRKSLHRMMRQRMLGIFDAMGQAVMERAAARNGA